MLLCSLQPLELGFYQSSCIHRRGCIIKSNFPTLFLLCFVCVFYGNSHFFKNLSNAERASKFARWKSLAHQSQDHDMALKFTAEEHKTERYVEWGVWATFLDYWMAWVCDYGRSIKRPIVGLVAINLVAFSYTDQWFDHHNNLPNNTELESALEFEFPLFFSQAMGNLIANDRACVKILSKFWKQSRKTIRV